MCGCKDLGEALRRISEGAALIRTKGEAGTGNIIEAVRHMRLVNTQIRRATVLDESELFAYAKELGAPIDLLRQVAKTGKLPVVMFSAGGVATPADAALMMQLGCDGVFVYVQILSSSVTINPMLLDVQRFGNLQILQPGGSGKSYCISYHAFCGSFHLGGSLYWTGIGDEGRRELACSRKGNDSGSRLLVNVKWKKNEACLYFLDLRRQLAVASLI